MAWIREGELSVFGSRFRHENVLGTTVEGFVVVEHGIDAIGLQNLITHVGDVIDVFCDYFWFWSTQFSRALKLYTAIYPSRLELSAVSVELNSFRGFLLYFGQLGYHGE
jgi:hypothetical protein